jgi:hypothetical protein
MYPFKNPSLAPSITYNANRQTYFMIKYLVDRPLVPDAYRAYAYFRWVDDSLDQNTWENSKRLAFIARQKSILKRCYEAQWVRDLSPEERLLASLIALDRDGNSGLYAYLFQMMQVMEFDAKRLGCWITQAELHAYTQALATAVTEALHYFIGHTCERPRSELRYLAVSGAHITHMLRDTFDDLKAGYFNIPEEYVTAHQITPWDVSHDAYQTWVKIRVQLARSCFQKGKTYLAQVENPRCRFAGYGYMARFEGVLEAIERENYLLRPAYPERKSAKGAFQLIWATLGMMVASSRPALAHPAHRPIFPNRGDL